MHNDRPRIELLNGLLMTLPGTPIVYYGDEIGMGDNIYLGDRDGVRTPMQWTADRNAGFSTANPQQLFLPVNIDPEYRFESVNVDSQRQNSNSLLMWMRRLIAMRQQYPVFGTGEIEFLLPDNSKVLCYLRSDTDTTVLVVANLSRFAQFVELDLSQHAGSKPVELFGKTDFPAIGELPYLLTLGPHDFYWFELEPGQEQVAADQEVLPTVTNVSTWATLFDDNKSRSAIEKVLPDVLRTRRWFAAKARRITNITIAQVIDVPLGTVRQYGKILLLDVVFTEGESQTYVLPMTYLPDRYAADFLHDHLAAGLIRLRPRGDAGLHGLLCEAMSEEMFTQRLLAAITQRKQQRNSRVDLRGVATKQLRGVLEAHDR